MKILKSQWKKLLQPFSVQPRVSQKIFLELVAAYSGVGRFYHTLKHIQQVLETIDDIQRSEPLPRSVPLDFSTIQLAAWYHDVVYNPQLEDNEDKSAEYAGVTLTKLSIAPATIERVKALILSTKTHQAPADDIECQILLDADLAILGSRELAYKAYAESIRQEYAWIPDEEYRLGRKRILEKFLQRNRVYYTDQLFLSLEAKARQNLQAEIQFGLSFYSPLSCDIISVSCQ